VTTKVLGADQVGTLAVNDGVVFYLTPCCAASVTGVCLTADNPDGVACRKCYQPVDPALAAAWTVAEYAAKGGK
jgi:hypothetical protein